MLENRGLMSVVRKCSNGNSEAKSEIITGDMYHLDPVLQTFSNFGENPSLAFSVDGIQPFQSSNKTLWLIPCTINVLDVHLKSRFLILNTLWFGKSKPDFNTFMTPFVNAMKYLFEKGISWKDRDGIEHVKKFLAPIGICYSPARCALAYMTQYSGWNGCTYCMHKGQTDKKRWWKKDILVYPLNLPLQENRTHSGT